MRMFRIGPIAGDNGVSAWGLYREVPLMPLQLLAEFATEEKAQAYADRLSEFERRKGAQDGGESPDRWAGDLGRVHAMLPAKQRAK